jgi:hypothetical protein
MLLAHGAVRGAGIQDDCVGYAAVEERVDQQRLRRVNYNTSLSNEEAKEQSIMGWGR